MDSPRSPTVGIASWGSTRSKRSYGSMPTRRSRRSPRPCASVPSPTARSGTIRRSSSRAASELDPSLGPFAQAVDDRLQALPRGRQLVGAADRRARTEVSLDEPLGLELAETLGQEAVGEVRDRGQELVETLRTAEHHTDDRAAPPTADQLDRVVVTRAELSFFLGLGVFAAVPLFRHVSPHLRFIAYLTIVAVDRNLVIGY